MAENSTKTAEHLKPHQFKPGQSGNPGGRPKNPLKDYQRAKFANMTDEEKDAFLEKIPPEIRWKMAEGNPESENTNTEVKKVRFDDEELRKINADLIRRQKGEADSGT